MQQTSGANAPILNPAGPAPLGPVIAPSPEEPRKQSKWWAWVLLLAVVAGASAWYYNKRKSDAEKGQLVAALMRTATAQQGPLQRTLRLTGSTSAEKYVSLIAPQMRGGRGSYSAASMMGGGGGMRSQVSSSSSGGSSSSSSSPARSTTSTSSSSSSATSASGAGSGGGADASTAFSSGGGGARSVQNSVSRVGGGSRSGGSSSGGASRSAAAPSATMGSGGLGSTAAALPGGGGGGAGGGGGGGGGGSDFMMVLQHLTNPGKRVKAGETVAEFDRQYMLQRLDDYKSAVASAEASFKKQKAELTVTREQHAQQIKVAKAEMDKAELDLKTLPVRGQIDSEKLNLAFEGAKAKYKQMLAEVKFIAIGEKAQNRSAEIDLEQTKIEQKRAETSADRMLAKAPIEGLIVMMTTFRSGEFGAISQGDQLYPGQMYMQIVNPDSMIINATVNQSDIDDLRIGQRATVKFDAYPDLVLPARIVTIGAMTKSGGFRQSFYKEVPVRLKLEKMDPRVIPDLSISADVSLQQVENAVIVPLESVFYEGDTQSPRPDSKPYVYTREGTVWKRREVELGLKSSTRAVIKSGLKTGEEIALNSPTVLKAVEAPKS